MSCKVMNARFSGTTKRGCREQNREEGRKSSHFSFWSTFKYMTKLFSKSGTRTLFAQEGSSENLIFHSELIPFIKSGDGGEA